MDNHHLVALDPYHIPYWLDSPLPILDYLLQNFLSNDSIMEIMSWDESLWEDHHRRFSILPNSNLVEPDFMSLIIYDIIKI